MKTNINALTDVKPVFPVKLDDNFNVLQFREIPGYDGYAIDNNKNVWTCKGSTMHFDWVIRKHRYLPYRAHWKRMKSRFVSGKEVIRLIAGKGQKLFPVDYLFGISWNNEI